MSHEIWEIRLAKIIGILFPFIILRIDFIFYSMTLYMLLILCLCTLIIIKNGITITITAFDFIVYIFLLILLLSTLYSPDLVYSFEGIMKIFLVIVLYIIIKNVFKNHISLITIIMKYSILGVIFLMIYLGYVYLIQFGETYIALNTLYATESSKNSLAFMCTIISGFMFSYLIKMDKSERFKLIKILFIVLGLLLMIAIRSRALFIIIGIYFLYFIFKSIKQKKIKLLGATPIMLFLIVYLVPSSIISEIKQEFLFVTSFFNNTSVVTDDSISTRSTLLDIAVNNYSENPIFGSGFGSFQFYSGDSNLVSHNDYMLILSEQGILGLLIFLLLIISIVMISYKNLTINYNFTNLGLFLSILGLSIYLLFINAYDNFLLWSLIAFIEAIAINYRNRKNNIASN